MASLSRRWLRRAALGLVLLGAMASCVVVDDQPGPYAGYYDLCAYDWQCPAGTWCELVEVRYSDAWVADRVCTSTCYDDLDCLAGGFCEDAAGSPPLCFEPCIDDFDCPLPLACVARVDGVPYDPICLPW